MTQKQIREIQAEKGKSEFTKKFIMEFEKEWDGLIFILKGGDTFAESKPT